MVMVVRGETLARFGTLGTLGTLGILGRFMEGV